MMLNRVLGSIRNMLVRNQWDFSDRRNLLRVQCKIEVQVQTSPEVLMPAEVLDISLTGLRLLCFGPVRNGQTLTVRHRQPGLSTEVDTVSCKVAWVEKTPTGSLVGVAFEDDGSILLKSWVHDELKALGMAGGTAKQKRENVRVVCAIPARCYVQGEPVRKSVIRDIGLGGSRVEVPGGLIAPGHPVVLKFGPIKELPKVGVGAVVVAPLKGATIQYRLRFAKYLEGGPKEVERYLTFFLRS